MNRIHKILILGLAVLGLAYFSTLPSKEINVGGDTELSIHETIKNYSPIARANYKSKEIAKLNFAGVYTDTQTGITVEIKDGKINQIDGGIELYARAWKGTKQLGLGSDGKTEWERFRIFNPPILVNDPLGNIVRTWTDEVTKETKTRTLREDPLSAIKSSLAHTIKVSSKSGTNMVKGSIGNTTDTFYPDADPESTSVDGYLFMSLGVGSGDTWANMRTRTDAVSANPSGASGRFVGWGTDNGTGDKFRNLWRSIFLFDTSTLTSGATISSATLSLFGNAKTDPHSDAPTINIYPSTPASNTDLVAGDYVQIGTTEQATTITYASFSTSAYNDFTLNATGISNISKTGVSKFGTRDTYYDIEAVTPAHPDLADTDLSGYFADQAGTDNDPKLVVVYTTSAGGGGAFPRIFINE